MGWIGLFDGYINQAGLGSCVYQVEINSEVATLKISTKIFIGHK